MSQSPQKSKCGICLIILGVFLCLTYVPSAIMIINQEFPSGYIDGQMQITFAMMQISFVLVPLILGITLVVVKSRSKGSSTAPLADVLSEKPAVYATPLQWADPTFLTFFKEYWDTNITKLSPALGVTIVILILPDRQEVIEPACIYLKSYHGRLTPRITRDLQPDLIQDAVYLAGNPGVWREAIVSQDATLVFARDTIPADNLKILKARILKTILPMGNRVATRLASGVTPSLDPSQILEFGSRSGIPNVTETLDLSQYATATKETRVQLSLAAHAAAKERARQLMSSPDVVDVKLIMHTPERDIEVLSKAKTRQLVFETYLADLEKRGPNGMGEFWAGLEKLPKPETYKNDPILEQPFFVSFEPEWPSELLALRGTSPVLEVQYDLAREFFRTKLTNPPS